MKKAILAVVMMAVLTGCGDVAENFIPEAGLEVDVDSIAVIPRPVKMEITGGAFVLRANTKILVSKETESVGNYLAELLGPATGYDLKVKKVSKAKCRPNSILRVGGDADTLGAEGYKLKVHDNRVCISGATEQGVFYGVQTLRQLLPVEIFQQKRVANVQWLIPQVSIEDEPRYKWRGMHLDVCRHFFDKEFVKKYIDLLAMHKMNTFHWHLTEDQGWRIEIKKYPGLTEIGSVRAGEYGSKYPDGETYGGFYTQDEVREVVAYAAERFITVVPEIEMPGHAVAALTAYPEFSCTGGPFTVREQWGVSKDIYCAGNEDTFKFLEDIVSEVVDLFPGEYFHIGGDEAPKDRWSKCAKCQARIESENLKDEHGLQSYFIKRMEKFLATKNKRLIGWDEILEGGLAPNATVMSWRGMAGGIAAAKQGHDVVMSPMSHCYYDFYQAPAALEPKAIGGYVPLEKVYSYNPTPDSLTEQEARHIMGAQGNVWTEYIPTTEHVEYMSYPRACALSEVVWSPKLPKDYDEFFKRLQQHVKRLDGLDVHYRGLDAVKVAVGGWKSGQTSEQFATMEWDITDALDGAGSYAITFAYSGGSHRLDINEAEILADGESVAKDAHPGTTGGRNEGNTYTVTIESFDKTAKYTLRANVRSDGGTDSNGSIYISKKKP